jgi:N-acetyl-anhydromuramyl-L-alanine amidase AmpD
MTGVAALPNSTRFEPVKELVLPKLDFVESPNQSDRTDGITPFLVVIHRPVANYESALRTLTSRSKNPVSAHVLTEGKKATQLVPWHRKAWTCASFNTVSYNIEVDDNAWDGSDWDAFFNAAHIAAWICHKTGIPPSWSRDPANRPGVTRHLDLGAAGGGHTDPTSNLTIWRNFIRQVTHDVEHTGWRRSWGTGRFVKLAV